jgi:hypothetical protein
MNIQEDLKKLHLLLENIEQKNLEELQFLLKKIYMAPKNEKHINYSIELEQWIWTVNDKLNKDFNLNINLDE